MDWWICGWVGGWIGGFVGGWADGLVDLWVGGQMDWWICGWVGRMHLQGGLMDGGTKYYPRETIGKRNE